MKRYESKLMNMLLGKISISLLLMLSMTSLFARPDNREGREAEHAARQQQRSIESGEYQSGRRINQEQSRQGDNGDGGRKNGRLSPDERRALRRQINEAGQDIYIPKR